MKLANLFGIRTVASNLIRLTSGELCYITKRIDRNEDDSKRHMIDFQQILELSDKYKGTMENLGLTIGDLSVNTLMDKLRFFELAVFNYIIGNNDMHLKNFSMWLSDMGWILSPAYDLLNVKLVLPKDKEDTALLLGGKKSNLKKSYFDRLGTGLGLNEKQINTVYNRLPKWIPQATRLIEASFLSSEQQSAYKKLIGEMTLQFSRH
jgi:serine/threonine-protein kinase HipA